ncbi:uncharacterized protein BDZ99DRAFT_527155 [Mytilinidion resinicola]|uniref:Uncharacterized protein n=1 Tax=Mytilinidion resinicola TaxID=574789 RepID=A0A6A6Y4J6_9PEZI|nr:uncharacterized protein BDZ99DRAFT_527155 [Mytilinidion resinicola]KAF2802717.1 hypothetical protein BDZ99DRAFT_527155 [Mytilinidion resinicola]
MGVADEKRTTRRPPPSSSRPTPPSPSRCFEAQSRLGAKQPFQASTTPSRPTVPPTDSDRAGSRRRGGDEAEDSRFSSNHQHSVALPTLARPSSSPRPFAAGVIAGMGTGASEESRVEGCEGAGEWCASSACFASPVVMSSSSVPGLTAFAPPAPEDGGLGQGSRQGGALGAIVGASGTLQSACKSQAPIALAPQPIRHISRRSLPPFQNPESPTINPAPVPDPVDL